MENSTEKTKEQIIIDHLKWLYPRLEIGIMGNNKYGIHYKGMIFASDFDKINKIGFDVVCVQSADDNGIIATIKDHRKDR